MASVKATGLKRFLRNIDGTIRQYEREDRIFIKCKATNSRMRATKRAAGKYLLRGGTWSRTGERKQLGLIRTGEDNAKIYMEQMAEGRDPLFLDDAREHSQVAAKIKKAAKEDIEKGARGKGLKTALDLIGKLMVRFVKRHIKEERSEKGAMRGLKARTLRKKEALYGAGRGILVASGQLRRSLYHKVGRSG